MKKPSSRLGRNIRRMRQSAGWNQETLCQNLSQDLLERGRRRTSQNAVSRMEVRADSHLIRMDVLESLTRVFSVSYNMLFLEKQ